MEHTEFNDLTHQQKDYICKFTNDYIVDIENEIFNSISIYWVDLTVFILSNNLLDASTEEIVTLWKLKYGD
jgi:hypothetical protein